MKYLHLNICFLIISSFLRLHSQNSVSLNFIYGNGDKRIFRDTLGTFNKELGLSAIFYKNLIDRSKHAFDLGGGLSYFNRQYEHIFAHSELATTRVRAENTIYLNFSINALYSYRLKSNLTLKLNLVNHSTVFVLPKSFNYRYLFGKFKYYGSELFSGIGYRVGRHEFTPMVRAIFFRPTDKNLFIENVGSDIPESYKRQVIKKYDFNNPFMIGLQYSYYLKSAEKHKKGKLVCI
jgi:hypothetical protein